MLAVLQAILLGMAAGGLLRRERGHALAMAGGAARVVLTLGLAVAVGFVVSKLIVALTGQPRPWRSRPLPSWLALTLAAAAVGSAGQLVVDRLRPVARLYSVYAAAAGGLLLWTVPSLLLAFRVPGASYPFTLPALLGSAALLVAVLRTEPRELDLLPTRPATGWLAFAVLLATALPALLLWLPIMRVLLVMVGANLHPAATVPAALLVTLVEPLHRLFPLRLRALLPAVWFLFAVACVSWAGR